MGQNVVSVIVKGIDRVSHIIRDLEDQLRDLRDQTIDLDVTADIDRAQREIKRLHGHPINIDVDANTARARAQIESLRFVKDIKVPVDADTALARAEIESLRAIKDIDIPVEVHTKKALAELQALKKVIPDMYEVKVDLDADISKLITEIESVLKRLPDRHYIKLVLEANKARLAGELEALKRNLPNKHFLNVRVDKSSAKAAAEVEALLKSLPDEHEIEVKLKNVEKTKKEADEFLKSMEALFSDEKEMKLDIDISPAEKKLSRLEQARLDPIGTKLKYMQSIFDSLTDNMDISKLQDMLEFQQAWNDGAFDTQRLIQAIEKQLAEAKKHVQEMANTDMSESVRKAVGEVERLDQVFEDLKGDLQVVVDNTPKVRIDIDQDNLINQARKAADVAKEEVDRRFRENRPGLPLHIDLQFFNNQTDLVQNRMNQIRDIIERMPGLNGKLLLAPAVIPMIASATGAVGGLAAALSAAGATATLAIGGLTAGFATAGVGVVGFGAVAIPTLSNIFDKSKQLKDLQDQLANTTNERKRCEILKEMAELQGSLNQKQLEGVQALQKFQQFWQGFTKQFETPVIHIFIQGLQLLQTTLTTLQPAIQGAMVAISNNMQSLNEAMKAPDMKAFFEFVNTTAGPAIQTFGEAFGYAIRGILNLMTAFSPVAMQMTEGFRNMMQSFSEWSAKLGESQEFQNFVNFAQTTGMTALSQLGQIFSNVFDGIISVIQAFMPYQQQLTQAIVDATARFAEWASTLQNSEGFKQFVEYSIQQIPKVVEFLAQLAQLFFNIVQAAAPFGAVLLEIGTRIAEFLNWLLELNPIVSSVIVTFGLLVGAINPIHGIFMKIWEGGQLVAEIFSIATPILTRLWGAFSTLSTGLLTVVRPAIIAIGTALRFLATNPIGLAITAVGALAFVIYKNWDEIKAKTEEIWSRISGFLSKTWDDILAIFFGPIGIITKLIISNWNTIKATSEMIWNAIKEFFRKYWDEILIIFFGPIGMLVKTIVNNWGTIESTTKRIWGGIKEFFRKHWDEVLVIFLGPIGMIVKAVISNWESIGARTKKIWDGVANTIKGSINSVISSINRFIGAVNDIEIHVPSVDIPLVGEVGGFTIGMPNIPKIPMLAKGGLITNATMAVVGEGRYNEAVLPLSDKVFSKLASGIVQHMGGGSGVKIEQHFHTNVDEYTIQRATERAIRRTSLNWATI